MTRGLVAKKAINRKGKERENRRQRGSWGDSGVGTVAKMSVLLLRF